MTNRWFTYDVRVQPHHTDYSGVVWHGTYIQWLEAARVECLRSLQFSFEEFVAAGFDLPVVDLQLQYRQSLLLGDLASVKTRLEPQQGIRLVWQYEIENSLAANEGARVTGQVTLVPVSMTNRKIARRLPPPLQDSLSKLHQYFDIKPEAQS